MSQILAYSPFLLPFMLAALVRALQRARSDDRDLFVTSFSWPVLYVVLGVMVWIKDAEPHWAMVGFIPAAIAAGHSADGALSRGRRLPVLAIGGVLISAVLYVATAIHMHSNVLFRLLATSHYDARADMSNEMIGWERVRSSLERAVHATPGLVVLASNQYAMCGRLAFETGDSPEVYCPTARPSAFDFFGLGRRYPPAHAAVIMLTNDIETALPPTLELRTCSPVTRFPSNERAALVARYFVYSCTPIPGEKLQAQSGLELGPTEGR